MAERIKKHWDIALVFGLGSILVISALFASFPNPVSGQVATTVVVTATVQEYITFTSSATSTTLQPDLVDTSGSVAIGTSSTITLTVNTSSADGYSIDVATNDNDGLISGANSIQTYNSTATIAAGTNGFGLQGVSSNMTIDSRYSWATSTNNIGSASTAAAVQLATDASPGSNQVAYIRFLAAATSTQPSGSYVSTVTLTAIPSP